MHKHYTQLRTAASQAKVARTRDNILLIPGYSFYQQMSSANVSKNKQNQHLCLHSQTSSTYKTHNSASQLMLLSSKKARSPPRHLCCHLLFCEALTTRSWLDVYSSYSVPVFFFHLLYLRLCPNVTHNEKLSLLPTSLLSKLPSQSLALFFVSINIPLFFHLLFCQTLANN